MAAPKKSILETMLDRLFAGLASGPNLNCRPHSSRQRVDWTQFVRFQDLSPADALKQLLSDKQAVQLKARVEPPKKTDKPAETRRRSKSSGNGGSESSEKAADPSAGELSPEEQRQKDDWSAQQSLLTKLRGLAEDAREYEQDTGVHALHVGFPLLSLPPGISGLGGTKRLLAPISFVSVALELQAGPHPTMRIEGLHDGADFLVPNEALFAWLERQTGKQILPESVSAGRSATEASAASGQTAESETAEPEDNSTEQGQKDDATVGSSATPDPWQELNDLVRRVSEALNLTPTVFSPESFTELCPAPRADDQNPKVEIVPAAVIGLFPMNNQGLLRDMQQMVSDPGLKGPVQSFITLDVQLDAPVDERERPDAGDAKPSRRLVESEQLVALADPCQARAVRLARECRGLVVHGPPGTGKSQTITNMIGDHLVRGQRVLLVCDKRTALDVVFRRLDHLGLGSLCALIHDPQHDQRNLYKQVKEQLEELASTKTRDRAESSLQSLNRRMQKSYDTLTVATGLVIERDPDRKISFHERIGEWLEAATPVLMQRNGESTGARATASDQLPSSTSSSGRRQRRRDKSATEMVPLEPVSLVQFEAHESEVREVIERSAKIQFVGHPWRACVGISLTDFLQRLRSSINEDIAVLIDCARTIDETRGGSIPLLAPSTIGLSQQVEARRQLVDQLNQCQGNVEIAWRQRWAKASSDSVERALEKFKEACKQIGPERESLDLQLLLIIRDRMPTASDVLQQVSELREYLATRGTWYAWVAFRETARAFNVLRSYGLTLSYSNAERLNRFLSALSGRYLMAMLLEELSAAKSATANLLDDETLFNDWDHLGLLLGLLGRLRTDPAVANLSHAVLNALATDDHSFADKLVVSIGHAEALVDLQDELVESKLFDAVWIQNVLDRACAGESLTDEFQQLERGLDSLTDVLRIRQTLGQLPTSLRALTERVMAESTDAETAQNKLRYQVLSDDIAQWLKSKPDLQALDGSRLNDLIREVQQQQQEKQELVRDLILDLWTNRQRERLLASTGTRLNSRATDLRRRLTTRGERAMRMRQVIAAGSRLDGGDPLFDLRPVWMASPETVAQIFPRDELFDVVIFDEASQCRLEEALPVLTRAKRVVIAGDPKQLPPTRFFESALVTSDNAAVETESDLFEAHQREIEDLLTAALSLEIQESYLDVHYRSRNADLVEFSNEQFYGSRLQAIPGHPKNRVRYAPITLYHVGGVYDERCNESEALEVCRIVADLLRRAEPPSIGIACFNLTQRDLILKKLDERCAEDADFASRLAIARSRIGSGAFEGLFVKNLENVQGDERDHMIISTTYGPDKQGRFYKRFGPLGQAGGGRRLNVLVTRARDEVHLVTSIPKELYRNLPPVPKGQQPGGAWLLLAYLAYAQELADYYGQQQSLDDADAIATVNVAERPSHTPSSFARAVAQLIAQRHNIGSDVHWGNEGFCVDVAFHHPSRRDDRTLGLLCDATRFQYAEDAVEWDLFRTKVLEDQGWKLTRCWSPEFFRDPEGFLNRFATEASRIADSDPDPEAIPVQPE